MPAYEYRCGHCGNENEDTFPIGEAPSSVPCPDCGKSTLLVIGAGVNIAPSALEARGRQVRMTTEMEAQWDKDLPAYKRMRHRGLQPNQIDGSAALENTVDDQLDIQMKNLTPPGMTRQGMRDAMVEGKEKADEIMANPVAL